MNQICEDHYCSYGCGNIATFRFKNGKYCCSDSRNKCPALKLKNAKGNTGRIHSEETKQKISKGNIGKEGIVAHPYQNFFGELCSYGCGQRASYEYDNGTLCCSDDWHRCPAKKKENAKRKVEEFKDKDRKERHRNSVKESWTKEERLIKQYDSLLNRPEYKEKMSKLSKDRWANDEEYRQIMKKAMGDKLLPNKHELILIDLFKEMNLDFIFTGDYGLWIDGKNPDFLLKDTNKILEYFGDHWHNEEMTGISKELHEQQRIDHFKTNGYDCIVVWEEELHNLEKLKQKIISYASE